MFLQVLQQNVKGKVVAVFDGQQPSPISEHFESAGRRNPSIVSFEITTASIKSQQIITYSSRPVFELGC